MKKIILIVSIITAIILCIYGIIYMNAVKPVHTAEEKAMIIAKSKTDLVELDDFHLYHGRQTVYVLEGKDEKGKKIIVWIPEKSKKAFVRKASKGLSKQEAIDRLNEEASPTKILSVRLGMEKDFPLWEIYYLSENNLINYYYVHFETGETLKSIENL